MKCVICREGETHKGTVTVTLERDETTIVFKGVPAEVCINCEEEFVDEKITEKLLKSAEEVTKAGVQVDIRQYLAA